MKKLLLYIFNFHDSKRIKIGITTKIVDRINKIQEELNKDVDFNNSIVVLSKKNSDIRLLERNLLRITEKSMENIDVNGKIRTEYRSKKCFQKIINYIEKEQDFGIELNLFRGIDISNNYNHTIPKVYFPPNIYTQGLSPILIKDLRKYLAKENLNESNFFNKLIFNELERVGENRKNIKKDYSNYFKLNILNH